MGIKAEDIIADHENYAILNGVSIRKGTMGAALANAEIFISNNSTAIEKDSAKKMLEELATILAHSLFNKHLSWKNSAIQEIFDKAIKND